MTAPLGVGARRGTAAVERKRGKTHGREEKERVYKDAFRTEMEEACLNK